ncbi:AEC family transporter [Thermotoga sp. KOL6]|uniref:AEC family transporter n=1 Tax=Thermotoga sp. KOL6 TaxID=126741 RepID=UPI000C793A3C|nr:AEC family transporter [Thermotoga sp. KOL6]PLV59166.1 transporter [Thermotoga sp. KOL6]
MLSTTFTAILPSFFIILIGYTVGKIFSREAMGLASKIAIWVMVPTVTFTFVNEFTPSVSNLKDFGIGMVILSLFFYLYSRFFREKKDLVFVTSVASNAGYLGYPILLSLWGEEALALGVVYAFLIVLMYTILPAFLGKKLEFKNLLRLPYIYVLPIAFLTGKLGWHYKDLPPYILSTVQMIKGSAIPYLLLYVGLSVSKVKVGKHLLKIGATIIFNKLVFAPLIALGFVVIYKLNGLAGKVFVLETAMPVAVNSVVLLAALNGDDETAGFGVTVTTFFAVFTLPIWAIILESIFI